MTYVISDLHGYSLEKLKMLLKKAGFCKQDNLYILGDIVDRNGDGGVEMLCWLLSQPNIYLILGNHEAMLLSCSFVLEQITDAFVESLSQNNRVELLSEYMFNGGDVTLKALGELNKKSPEVVSEIFDYLRDAPPYDIVEVNGTDYLLTHSGIANFEKGKALSSYSPDDFLWNRPSLTDAYFSKAITVFGHTPTMHYGEEHKGKIIKTKTWINIDVGAAFGLEPVLLRLDDMQEFKNQPS